MAELDIKDIWNKGTVQTEQVKFPEVEHLEGAKSRNVLYWLRVILTIEFWLNVVGVPIAIYLEVQRGSSFTPAFLTVIGVVYFFYYLFLIRQLRTFDFSGNVKASLTKIYDYLKFYLLHYKVVIALSLCYGGIYEYYVAATEKGPFVWGSEHILPLLMLTVIMIPAYFIFSFLINLIYGRKIKKLKRIIAGLKED